MATKDTITYPDLEAKLIALATTRNNITRLVQRIQSTQQFIDEGHYGLEIAELRKKIQVAEKAIAESTVGLELKRIREELSALTIQEAADRDAVREEVLSQYKAMILVNPDSSKKFLHVQVKAKSNTQITYDREKVVNWAIEHKTINLLTVDVEVLRKSGAAMGVESYSEKEEFTYSTAIDSDLSDMIVSSPDEPEKPESTEPEDMIPF